MKKKALSKFAFHHAFLFSSQLICNWVKCVSINNFLLSYTTCSLLVWKKEEMNATHGGSDILSGASWSCLRFLISSSDSLVWCFHCVIYITCATFTLLVAPFLCYKSQIPLKTIPLFSQDCLSSAELLSLIRFPLQFLSARVWHAYISLEMPCEALKVFLWLVVPLNLRIPFLFFHFESIFQEK